MKTTLSILSFSLFCCYHADAQTATSSKKNAHAPQAVTEPVSPPPSANASSATIVSGQKQAVTKEVPVDQKDANGATLQATPVQTPSSRKPD